VKNSRLLQRYRALLPQMLAEQGQLMKLFLDKLKSFTGSRFLLPSEREPVSLMQSATDLKFEVRLILNKTRNVARRKQN
jgi:hypothetical protein